MKEFSGYIIRVYRGDFDPASVAARCEQIEAKFPGASTDVVEGDPFGSTSGVTGPNPKICKEIRDWVNANP